MTNAFLTSFNHRSLSGVEEIVELLAGEFQRQGLNAISRRNLPEEVSDGDLLVIVDEFSEPLILEALRRFKISHPKVTFICVLTEFFSSGGRVRPPGLNSFKQPWHSLLFDNLLYVFCFMSGYLTLFKGLKIRSPGPANYLLATLGLVWLAVIKVSKPWIPLKKVRHFRDRAYLWFRALGLQSVSGIFDHYLTLHPAIGNEALAKALRTDRGKIQTLLIPPPTVEKSNLVNFELEFGLDMSGAPSAYRRKQIARAISLLRKLSPGERFANYKERGFDDAQEKLLLSFNIPQSSTWRYSSPMRIVGAVKRGQIPVVSQKFGDHPAEDLALLFPDNLHDTKSLVSRLVLDRSEYINSAWEKLQNYTMLADENNRNIIFQLKGVNKFCSEPETSDKETHIHLQKS